MKTELELYKMAAPLCDKHKPDGGARANCLICGLMAQSAALSKISYLCGPPNEMECSMYDVHCNEEEVVKRVAELVEEKRELERRQQVIEEWCKKGEEIMELVGASRMFKIGKWWGERPWRVYD